MPFSLEIGQRMQARLLPFDDPAGYKAAALMPHNISQLDVLEVAWPRSKRLLKLSLGQTAARSAAQEQHFTSICAQVDDGSAQLAELTRKPVPGSINRICIWPADGSDGDLVVLFSLAAAGPLDSAVYAIAVSASGAVRDIPTSGASSAFGGFDVIDLNEDSRYELVTSRNLDGMLGGFSYHAVRSYTGAAYEPDPEPFRQGYFADELAFLDWVVDTREKIQLDPEAYIGRQHYGFFYAAEYQKQLIGFDSIVEVPMTAGGVKDLPAYNRQRAEAFRRVVRYRDELRAWLNGGERPATWKLAR